MPINLNYFHLIALMNITEKYIYKKAIHKLTLFQIAFALHHSCYQRIFLLQSCPDITSTVGTNHMSLEPIHHAVIMKQMVAFRKAGEVFPLKEIVEANRASFVSKSFIRFVELRLLEKVKFMEIQAFSVSHIKVLILEHQEILLG